MTNSLVLSIFISDDMYGLSNIVDRHDSTAFLNNAVWFGKLERNISPRYVKKLNDQINQRIPTYVFILNAKGYNKLAYVANLINVSLKPQRKKI